MKKIAWLMIPLSIAAPVFIFIVFFGGNLNERVSPVVIYAVCLGLAAISALVSAQPDVRTKFLLWALLVAAVEASLLAFS